MDDQETRNSSIHYERQMAESRASGTLTAELHVEYLGISEAQSLCGDQSGYLALILVFLLVSRFSPFVNLFFRKTNTLKRILHSIHLEERLFGGIFKNI